LSFAFIAARLTIPDMLTAQRSDHWVSFYPANLLFICQFKIAED
jgi:hypothetical protein